MGVHDQNSAAEAATVPFVIRWRMSVATCDREAEIFFYEMFCSCIACISSPVNDRFHS